MKILFIGDVVGDNGMEILKKKLSNLKKDENIDFCIANGENANQSGVGLTIKDAQNLFSLGVDAITGGNHSLRRSSVEMYEENEFILCPQNLLAVSEDNCGVLTFSNKKYDVSVINLLGTAFLDANRNPFFEIDKILKRVSSKYIIIDFHAESTAEKQAFAHYVDGKVTAVVGTHTHVQTNDAQILENKTMYITDVGAVCSANSVIGVEKDKAILKQKYLTSQSFKVMNGDGYLHGVVLDIENNTIKTIKA